MGVLQTLFIILSMSKDIVYILIGGGIGSIGRYLLSEVAPHVYKSDFPIGTFVANIIGCFIIGVFVAIIKPNSSLDPLLITGFCGGFTTFSSFSKETFMLIHNQKVKIALFYILSSSLCGILAVLAGYSIIGK